MIYEEYEILFIVDERDRMDISNIFFVKASSMIRYICKICIFDSKLNCDEISVFINILIIFSDMIIFLRFDIIYSNTLSMNIISRSMSGYDRLFHIISLNLINLHRINAMCCNIIFSNLTSTIEISVFVAMDLLDEFEFNIL